MEYMSINRRQTLMMGYIVVFLLFLVPLLVMSAIPKKAGFSRWWVILLLIPFINLITVWVFAFIKWPNEHSNEA
jgi:energy-coupling factor transporter transmembrane protein EcfT